MNEQYLTLDALAARLGLPRNYLRILAHEKLIPYLNANGRLRFEECNMRTVLDKLAGNEKEER